MTSEGNALPPPQLIRLGQDYLEVAVKVDLLKNCEHCSLTSGNDFITDKMSLINGRGDQWTTSGPRAKEEIQLRILDWFDTNPSLGGGKS